MAARRKNPYDVLGVRPGASEDEIKRTYRELVKNTIRIITKIILWSIWHKKNARKLMRAYDELTSGNQQAGHNHNSSKEATIPGMVSNRDSRTIPLAGPCMDLVNPVAVTILPVCAVLTAAVNVWAEISVPACKDRIFC